MASRPTFRFKRSFVFLPIFLRDIWIKSVTSSSFPHSAVTLYNSYKVKFGSGCHCLLLWHQQNRDLSHHEPPIYLKKVPLVWQDLITHPCAFKVTSENGKKNIIHPVISISLYPLYLGQRSLIRYRLKFGCSNILSDPPDNVKSRIHTRQTHHSIRIHRIYKQKSQHRF